MSRYFSKIRSVIREHLWWFEDVFLPFGVTRIVLVFIGVVMAQIIPPSPFMPSQGWQFSPHKVIDIWGRWDSGWYMSIVEHGYSLVTNAESQANYAFFPLYPYLVRLFHALVPSLYRTRGTALLIGIMVSNLAFLGALTVLHHLVRTLRQDRHLAKDSIWYLCVFPASFAFSSFYAESLFLLLSVTVFYAAERREWWLAGLAGGLAALSRPPGVLVFIPLTILYWQREQAVRRNAIFLGLIPAGFLLYVLTVYRLTGNPLAWLTIHNKWMTYHPYFPIEQIDQASVLIATFMGLIAFRFGISYGIWTLILGPLGLLTKGPAAFVSATRYTSTAFPAFMGLSLLSQRRPWLSTSIIVVLSMLLAIFMMLWARYYWVQ